MQELFRTLFLIIGCIYINDANCALSNFQNISIQANEITLNEIEGNLAFLDDIKISFGNYLISGDEATLILDEESLKIYGNPATIKSEKIEGKAETFIIFPNEAMKMIGNAELNNQGNVINAHLITYQILSNE
jgi:lipopolysaccharide transport protein LptA